MSRFDIIDGVIGLLPTPYTDDDEIHAPDMRRLAEFCCATGQHGIGWPFMVGQFYTIDEDERIRTLDDILDTVAGRIPVIFGCAALSVPQTLRYAKAAARAGADAIIAMGPGRSDAAIIMDMFRRLADVYDGDIIIQNGIDYPSLSIEQMAILVEEIPQIQYIKEERPPGPRHIGEVAARSGDRLKGIFGGFGGKVLPEELNRGATGGMPACQFGDVLARVYDLWKAGDDPGARELHQRLLPLIIRESQPFMRHVLKRRGVFSSERDRCAPAGLALDRGEIEEIGRLVAAIAGDLGDYPYRAA